jgi:CSLREA domain-containing protein
MSGDLRCRRLIIGAPRRSSAVQRMASGLVWLFCVILAGPATANTITVNTPVDQNPSAVDGLCSLREAIQAVMDTSPQDGCPAGSPEGPPNSFTGRDTINFSVTGTIALAAPCRRSTTSTTGSSSVGQAPAFSRSAAQTSFGYSEYPPFNQ